MSVSGNASCYNKYIYIYKFKYRSLFLPNSLRQVFLASLATWCFRHPGSSRHLAVWSPRALLSIVCIQWIKGKKRMWRRYTCFLKLFPGWNCITSLYSKGKKPHGHLWMQGGSVHDSGRYDLLLRCHLSATPGYWNRRYFCGQYRSLLQCKGRWDPATE